MKLPWHWPLVKSLARRPSILQNQTRATSSVAIAPGVAAPGVAASSNIAQGAPSAEQPLDEQPRVAQSVPEAREANRTDLAVDVAIPSFSRWVQTPAGVQSSGARPFPHSLPKPALRWVGDGGRVALREFDFARDANAVCSWQKETYSLNFPDFRYTDSFASAFRHDLRRGALDPHHAIFVLDDGHLLGFLWLVICENTWTGDRYGYVNNVYLVPSQRGQGLAREMMNHAERWFRSRGIKRARLTVTASNDMACKLYENCGYETTRWEMEKEL